MKNLILFLLQGIPETIGFLALSLAFAQIEIKWRRITLLGALLAVVVYIIRLLPITFGIHTLIGPLMIVFFITKFTRTPLSKALLVTFLSLAILATLELIINEPILLFTKQNSNSLISDTNLWVLLGVIQALVLNVIALFVSKIRKPVKDLWII